MGGTTASGAQNTPTDDQEKNPNPRAQIEPRKHSSPTRPFRVPLLRTSKRTSLENQQPTHKASTPRWSSVGRRVGDPREGWGSSRARGGVGGFGGERQKWRETVGGLSSRWWGGGGSGFRDVVRGDHPIGLPWEGDGGGVGGEGRRFMSCGRSGEGGEGVERRCEGICKREARR